MEGVATKHVKSLGTGDVEFIEVKQRGRAAQQNAAAAIATGESLLFLHADTKLPADYFEACMKLRSQGAVAGAFRLQIDDLSRKYRWLERLLSGDRVG